MIILNYLWRHIVQNTPSNGNAYDTRATPIRPCVDWGERHSFLCSRYETWRPSTFLCLLSGRRMRYVHTQSVQDSFLTSNTLGLWDATCWSWCLVAWLWCPLEYRVSLFEKISQNDSGKWGWLISWKYMTRTYTKFVFCLSLNNSRYKNVEDKIMYIVKKGVKRLNSVSSRAFFVVAHSSGDVLATRVWTFKKLDSEKMGENMVAKS